MASVPVAATSITRSVANGQDLTAALGTSAASAGVDVNTFSNSGSTFLRVKNGNGAISYVTVLFADQTEDGIALSSTLDGTANDKRGKVFAVPATTGDRLLGPFPVSIYGSTVTVSFSVSTTVTVAVYEPSI